MGGGAGGGSSKLMSDSSNNAGSHVNKGFIPDSPTSFKHVSAANLNAGLKRSFSEPILGGSKITRTDVNLNTLQKGLGSIPPKSPRSRIKRYFYAFGGLLASGAVFSGGSMGFEAIVDALVGDNENGTVADITALEIQELVRNFTSEILIETENITSEFREELKDISEEFAVEIFYLKQYNKTLVASQIKDLFDEIIKDNIKIMDHNGNFAKEQKKKEWFEYLNGDNNIDSADSDDKNKESDKVKDEYNLTPTVMIAVIIMTSIVLITVWIIAVLIVMRCILRETCCFAHYN